MTGRVCLENFELYDLYNVMCCCIPTCVLAADLPSKHLQTCWYFQASAQELQKDKQALYQSSISRVVECQQFPYTTMHLKASQKGNIKGQTFFQNPLEFFLLTNWNDMYWKKIIN